MAKKPEPAEWIKKRIASITKGGNTGVKPTKRPKLAPARPRPKRSGIPHPWSKESQLTPHDQQSMNSKMLDVPLGPDAAENYKRMAEARNQELARIRRLNAENEIDTMRTGVADPHRARRLRERYHGYDRREDYFKIAKPPEMEQESVSRIVRAIEQQKGKGKGKP